MTQAPCEGQGYTVNTIDKPRSHSFLPEKFIEHLLCMRHWPRAEDTVTRRLTYLPFFGLSSGGRFKPGGESYSSKTVIKRVTTGALETCDRTAPLAWALGKVSWGGGIWAEIRREAGSDPSKEQASQTEAIQSSPRQRKQPTFWSKRA